MVSKKISLLSAIIIVVVVIIILFIYVKSTTIRITSYNSILGLEVNSINSYKGNLTLYYSGNFISNQPLSNFLINVPFSVPFNYTFYRNGNSNSTAISFYYNMGEYFSLQDLMSNSTVLNEIRVYADNGTKIAYNFSKLNRLLNKYMLSAPLSEIAFTNASGLYICLAYPSTNKNATLGIFSCSLVSKFTTAGLRYMIYNLSQISAHAVGFDLNELNMTVHYIGNSTFINQSCAEYKLSSVVKSDLVSSIYLNLPAYVNGTECISTKFYLPLYQHINVTIPSKGVYAFLNLTLLKELNTVPNNITTFPINHALNLTYGSIS